MNAPIFRKMDASVGVSRQMLLLVLVVAHVVRSCMHANRGGGGGGGGGDVSLRIRTSVG